MTTGTTMLSTNSLLSYYGFTGGTFNAGSSIVTQIPRAERRTFGAFEGSTAIDTPEEFLTAAYFSPVQIVITDASAAAAVETVLPHADPRTAGLKLGAMWYKKIVELQFCDPTNTAQLANYELAINTISTRTGVSRADMVEFFRSGINSVVSESVEREFNTISFMMSGGGKTFNSVLTRNASNGYTLRYEGTGTGGLYKEITTASLDSLLAAMSASPDFNAACVSAVRSKATLIPAIVYADWKARFPGVADGVALTKEALTNFYLNPTKNNYDVLLGIYARFIMVYRNSSEKDPFALLVLDSLNRAITALSSRLNAKFENDAAQLNCSIAALIPADPRYNVFSIPYGVGGGS